MHLVEPKAIRARLSLPDVDGLNDTIEEGLSAATAFIEAVLDTEVAEGEHTDLFYLDSTAYAAHGGFYQLRLAHGFLAAAAPTMQISGNAMAEVPSWETLPSYAALLNRAKGFVLVPAEHANKFVQVEYTAGFNSLDDVPEWLREVAIAHAIKVMSWQQTGDPKPALSNIYKAIDQHKTLVFDRHLRVSSRSIPPVFSS